MTAPLSEADATGRLGRIVRETPQLIHALEVARAVALPDWLLCAGAIRDAAWDTFHSRAPTPPRDVDLAFFDPGDLSRAPELQAEGELRSRAPQVPWQASNQAAVHLWYPERFGLEVLPFRSCAEAVATFPEIATCVGVRLLADDALLIVAPHGLEDLLGCVCRHNAVRAPAQLYEQRVETKGWRARWPRMR